MPGPHSRRGAVRRIVAVLVALAVLALATYTTYIGVVGSGILVDPEPHAMCATPKQQFGWLYEAINYDIADDAALALRNPDPDDCADQGTPAGNDVLTADGVSIAGWYIPAASGVGPEAPTVILVHGWNANKSEVLRYGVPLHDRFNLVAIDLRHGGRSGGEDITFGRNEMLDVLAVLDWLEREKRPASIGIVGNSMGGATTAAAARADDRIAAVLLDSTHAQAVNAFARRLVVEESQPPYPGAWAIALGVFVRTGQDVGSADPIGALPALGDRPVLLIHGTDDPIDVPAESAERNVAAARAAGVPIELRYCEGGAHGNLVDHCPDEWGQWATDFFERALEVPAGG